MMRSSGYSDEDINIILFKENEVIRICIELTNKYIANKELMYMKCLLQKTRLVFIPLLNETW